MKLPLSLSYCHCLFSFLQFSLLAHNYGWLVARRTPWTSCVRQAVCTVCLCNLPRNQRRSTRRTRRRRLSFLRWSASSTAGTLQAEVSPVIIETATDPQRTPTFSIEDPQKVLDSDPVSGFPAPPSGVSHGAQDSSHMSKQMHISLISHIRMF